MAQLPQAVDEALAALAVDPAGLQHGLALLHQLPHATHTARGLSSCTALPTRGQLGDQSAGGFLCLFYFLITDY